MIAGELLSRVASAAARSVGDPGQAAGLAASLRLAFPNIHFTVCSDNDMPPSLKPAFESSQVRLYYVDANEHCLKLTTDAEAASGLVVAYYDED
jgi:hypothetical protein